ncbi:restriction endonuclease subunit S [Vibrio campbellii]|uniref:restriction endonuclease subunit S n=1 Tax=Vibrio campbellii TaxID=680 RepID=UPI003F8463AB
MNIEKNWKRTSLGEFIKLKSGFAFKSKDYTKPGEGTVPIIRISDIQQGKVYTSNAEHVPSEQADVKFLIEKGDLLIAMSGATTGKTGVYSEDNIAFLNQRVGNLKLVNEEDSCLRYRDYLVQSLQSEISKRAYGAAQPNISAKEFESIEILLAPHHEQKRIANKLDAIFEKLEMAKSRLDKVPLLLKRFRMSVLSAAVSGELTEEWREVNPNLDTVLPDNYIQSYNGKPLDELPEGWVWVSFKNAAKIESNLVDPKLTPSDIHLAPNHIESNTGRILDLVTVEQDKVKSNKHRFYPGQIIYSKIRPYLNKVCTVDFEGVCSADMYPVKANINREYLLYVMLSDMFVYWTSQQQGRVVLPKINQKALNEIPVPVPPNEEQNEIARIVGELWAKADAVEKQYNLAKLRVDKLTQSILARAFRGELFEPFSDKAERVAQLQSEDVIDEQPTDREETTLEQADISSIQSQPTPKTVDDKSELLSQLKSAKKAMTAQQLFESASVETFKAIDELFVELKRLLELNLIEKVGEGENYQFKATK